MLNRISTMTAAMILIALNSAALAAGTSGADVNGDWVGQMSTGRGAAVPLRFQFRVEGHKLAGKVIVNNGEQEIPLYNGKIEGDKISFKIEGDTPDYTGEVRSQDEIEIKATMRGEHGTRTSSFTLKRATN